MNNSETYFNQLHFSSDLDELYRGINRLIDLGNFEATIAIRRYFLHTPIKESQIYIIKKIPDLKDLKSKFRLLIEFSYSSDKDLKSEVLNSIARINHPIFSHRLLSIYLNTNSDDKKIEILKVLISSGISLFKIPLLEEFEKESIRVQQYILTYLVNTPFLSEQRCRQIISLVSGLLSKENAEVDEGKLLHHLWLLSVNNPVILKESKKVLRKSKYGYSLLYHLYQVVKVDDSKQLSNAKVIDALYQGDEQTIHRVRFSNSFAKGFASALEKQLMEIEQDFHTKDHAFIWNLIRLNHSEIVSTLIDVFKRSNHFNFKQALLDVLSFFHLNDELKDRLKPVLIELFKEKEHSRIFESLSRNVILLFGHEGLKIVYAHYEYLETIEQRTQVLSGIIHAMMDFGFGKALTALDNYSLNMILGNSIDYAMATKKLNSSYVSKIFQIINLLQVDTYVDEMLLLAKRNGINIDILGALLSLNNEKATDFVINNFEEWTDNVGDNKEKIQLVLSELGRRRVKGMEKLSEEILSFLLEQPGFTGEVINYLQKYQRQELIPSAVKFHTIQTLHTQYSLSQLIGKYQTLVDIDIIVKMYTNGKTFIKKKLSPYLMKLANIELLEQVYDFYVEHIKDIKALIVHFKEIPFDKEVIHLHLELIKKIEHNIVPEYLSLVKEALAEHLYYYTQDDSPTSTYKGANNKGNNSKGNNSFFNKTLDHKTLDSDDKEIGGKVTPKEAGIKENPNSSNSKPIDKVSTQEMKQVLYTAEHLHSFFTKKINQEANLDTLDINSLTAEYRKFIFLGYRNYLLERKTTLKKNTSFLSTVRKVFSKAIYYQEFIKKSGHFNQVQFRTDKIEFWTDQLTEHFETMDDAIKDLEDVWHLYGMLLHQNSFYSIDNPLQVDLEYFYHNKIVPLLVEISSFKFEQHNNDTKDALAFILELRSRSKTLAGFLLELQKRN